MRNFLISLWLFILPIFSSADSFFISPWIDASSLRGWDAGAPLEGENQQKLKPSFSMLSNLLDSMEPGGPDGKVQLGYTLALNVYDLFVKQGDSDWKFEPQLLKYHFDLIQHVGRPVVISLSANHFLGPSKFAGWLAADPESLARFNDGTAARESYFDNPVAGFTFSMRQEIRINRYRFLGFRKALEELAKFEKKHPRLLTAVTLAGELHHFFPDISNVSNAGIYEKTKFTDYSKSSILDFVDFLQRKFADLAALNREFHTDFSSWKGVSPPRWDFRETEKHSASSALHMDAFASGKFPILGWMAHAPGDQVDVWIDGVSHGPVQLGLDRMDVYEARADFIRSDVGFYKDIDYRNLPPGRHQIQLVLQRKEKKFQLLEQEFLICSASSEKNPFKNCEFPAHKKDPSGLLTLSKKEQADLYVNLDQPRPKSRYWFNSFAAEWQSFREKQVGDLLRHFSEIAIQSGLPKQKLFSHTISPFFEGSWNRAIFALSPRDVVSSGVNLGVNLYGGKGTGELMSTLGHQGPYAVPEFHLRMGKYLTRKVFSQALEFHEKNGARFVSPYFMALSPQSRSPLKDLHISPLNPVYGSHFFYKAIVEAVQR